MIGLETFVPRTRARLTGLASNPMVALALLVASTMICISTSATMPLRFGDLVWQRWSGETILRTHRIATSLGSETFMAAGAPWTPQEWLFSVATTTTKNPILAGIFGVTVGSAVAAAIAIAAYRSWDRSRSGSVGSLAVVLISAIIIANIVPFQSLRAQNLAWLLLSVSLFIIEFGNRRLMFALLFISILWANIHASVILLPALLALRALSYALQDRRISLRAGSTMGFAVATLLCSWINPVGMGLTTFAVDLQKNVVLTTNIPEWQQPTLNDPIVAFIVLPLVVYGIAGTAVRRKWWDLLLVATFGYLSFRAGRHIALFAIAAAPAAIAAFSPERRATGITALNPLWIRRYAVTLSAVVSMAALLFVFFMPASVRGDADVAYADASEVALALPGEHRVFCQDFTWCSFLLGHPHFRVWWDGRADAYPTAVWRQALEITANQPPGASLRNLNRYRVDVVIAKEGAPVNAALAEAHWNRITDVRRYVIWQRRAYEPKGKAFSNRFSRTASSS